MEIHITTLGDIVYVNGVAHLVLNEETRNAIKTTLATLPYDGEEHNHG